MKLIDCEPPLKFEVKVTKFRKWWQFWKPKYWEELELAEFPQVWDGENQSFDEIYTELKTKVKG